MTYRLTYINLDVVGYGVDKGKIQGAISFSSTDLGTVTMPISEEAGAQIGAILIAEFQSRQQKMADALASSDVGLPQLPAPAPAPEPAYADFTEISADDGEPMF